MATAPRRLLGLVLFLSAFLAYLPAINAGFIWDDDLLLTANVQMQNGHGLAEIWLGRNTCDYTPLTLTTFWLEHQLWQDAAVGYHIVNILLHATAAVLLWRTLLALQIPGAWLAAFLFTIHPVNVASVAWIAERKNTLSGALLFAALLLFVTGYIRGGAERRLNVASAPGPQCFATAMQAWAGRCSEHHWRVANATIFSAMLFLLAGLSKGAVVGLPLVLAGCIFWVNGKLARRDLLFLAPFAAITLLIGFVTMHFQVAATDYRLDSSHLMFRLARAWTLPWLYLRDIIFPIGLSPFSRIWQPNLHSVLTYLPSVLLFSVLAAFLRKWHSWGKPCLLASGYYLWMLLPILGFIWMAFQQQAACADWWQYLAAPGIFAAIAAAFVITVRTGQKSRAVFLSISLGIAISLLIVQTWRRCAIYHSMESYCRAVLGENPHAWALQNNLGIVLKKRGDLVQAAARYRAALQDNPRYVQAHNNLGNVLEAQGKWTEAEAEFRAALKLDSRNSEILASLSQTFFAQGRTRDALATNAEAIKVDPANPEHYVQFGIKLAANKQYDQAIVCFNNALVLNPGNPRIKLELAQSLMATGRSSDAAAMCDSALQSAAESGDRQMIRALAMLRNECHSATQ